MQLLRSLLRPALRFCLRHSLEFQALSEIIKDEMLALAAQDCKERGEKITISRLSVMTGVHRKDATRLYRDRDMSPPDAGYVYRVLGQWEGGADFTTKRGKPRALSWKGDESEFKALVETVSKDISYSAMLSELERQGFVEKTRGFVKLRKVVEPIEDPEKIVELLGEDLDTMTQAVEENAFVELNTRNLHIRTEYDNVFKDDVPYIRQWFLKKGAELHREARSFLSGFDKDLNPDPEKEGGATVVIGSFSWTTRQSKTADSAES